MHALASTILEREFSMGGNALYQEILNLRPRIDRKGLNLAMPGNPRYQPKSLIPYFGYDFLYSFVARVEIANLITLGEIGIIPKNEMKMLTPTRAQKLLDIVTTRVDGIESTVTHHDIRAWIRAAQETVKCPLIDRWTHVPLTSYDALDTARTLQFALSYEEVVKPEAIRTIGLMIGLIRCFADQLQIGRTHGQSALPITVGFWLATILWRIHYNLLGANEHAKLIPGNITGAVGTRNAEIGLGISDRCGGQTYGSLLLGHFGLSEPAIATQIMPPDYMADYLFQCIKMSAALGQLGRDCRNLMRTEIAEIQEGREEGQIGSSTMPGKVNPIKNENLEGTWLKQIAEFQKVLLTMISDHQRDLVGSSVIRDFPTIVINLVHQLEILLRGNAHGIPFLSRMMINSDRCRFNFDRSAGTILGEPMYIALQMAGYRGDAHKLVNDELAPRVRRNGTTLISELQDLTQFNTDVAEAYEQIPKDVILLFKHPELYIGDASKQAHLIADLAEQFCQKIA